MVVVYLYVFVFFKSIIIMAHIFRIKYFVVSRLNRKTQNIFFRKQHNIFLNLIELINIYSLIISIKNF